MKLRHGPSEAAGGSAARNRRCHKQAAKLNTTAAFLQQYPPARCSSPAAAARAMLNGLGVINLAHPRTQRNSLVSSLGPSHSSSGKQAIAKLSASGSGFSSSNSRTQLGHATATWVLPRERETVLISNSLDLCPVGEARQDKAVILANNTPAGMPAG
jgi:hypothetical protein